MKKFFVTLNLIVSLAASLIVSAVLLPTWQANQHFALSGLPLIKLVLFTLFLFLILFISSLLAFRDFRIQFEKQLSIFFQKRSGFPGILILFFFLLLYESLQDILFLTSDMAAVHYQGYRQILVDFFPVFCWIVLASFQALLLLLLFRRILLKTHLKGIILKKWQGAALAAGVTVVLFDRIGLGFLPAEFQSKWFEELNSPLVGLQVILVVLVVYLIGVVGTFFNLKISRSLKTVGDLMVVLMLLLIAFLAWIGPPRHLTTFTDIPRPPNYEYYPNSDALGYQISAQSLLAGNGTGRLNHVAFWNFLAGLDLLSADIVTKEYYFWVGLISLIPPLLYLVTRSLGSRMAGIVVGLLFIIRESNSILLQKNLSIPQLRDAMTEPITLLGLLLAVFLFLRWYQSGMKNRILLLFSGGIFGWILLLRIEAAAYLGAVAIGILLLKGVSRWELVKFMSTLFLGVILVAGPWLLFQVQESGSISALTLGKGHLVTRAAAQIPDSGDGVQESNGISARSAIPYNLANNVMALFYYLPSNHQPLFTFSNLPDVILNRVDEGDLEGDTFREKYLERYVRSLPYWWNDWDGRLPARSYLPLAISLFLVFFGFLQAGEDRRALAIILGLMASFHIGVYTVAGKSGGRFIQVVDWIPLVFYGMGITSVINAGLTATSLSLGLWWTGSDPGDDIRLSGSTRPLLGKGLASLTLLLVGLSYPLAEVWLPVQYTEGEMVHLFDELGQDSQISFLPDDLRVLQDTDLELIYGKALYPRYYDAGTSLGGGNPKNRYTDFRIDRTEFYLVGTENIWVGLPGHQLDLKLPHGSDVLIVGTRSPQIKFAAGEEDQGGNSEDYFKALRILVFDKHTAVSPSIVLKCEGQTCGLP